MAARRKKGAERAKSSLNTIVFFGTRRKTGDDTVFPVKSCLRLHYCNIGGSSM